jgi:hypothetical protein
MMVDVAGRMAAARLAMAVGCVMAVVAQEVVELDSCEEAQQALEEYLVDAPEAPRNACHGSLEAGEDLDGQHIQTTPLCAQWRGECAANRSGSECSVGCQRLPGCRLHPDGPAVAQPDHPHGEAAAGAPGRCVPDEGQCVCPDEMLPLVETMYWSCPTRYTSGTHWDVSRPRWKAIVQSWGCNAARDLANVRWAVLAAALCWNCGFR